MWGDVRVPGQEQGRDSGSGGGVEGLVPGVLGALAMG